MAVLVRRVGRLARMLVALAIAMCCFGVASAAAAEIGTIPVGSKPMGVSADGTHVWVANREDDTVTEIEAATGTVVRTIPVGDGPKGVSSDGTDVWVTNNNGHTVSEIEVSSGTVIRTIPVGVNPAAVSADGTHVWVTEEAGETVSEIDASTGTVIRTITLTPASFLDGVASDGTDVWVTQLNHKSVIEIDASSGTIIRTIPVAEGPSAVAVDGAHVWVTHDLGEAVVSEIEASTGTVIHTIPVSGAPIGVTSDGTHVWVADASGAVEEIEASTGTRIHTIHVGGEPARVSSDGTHVWVTNRSKGTVFDIPASYTAECSGNAGTIKLSPGLTNTAAIQTLKIKGTLSGCAYEPFTEVAYTATLKTAGPVSCSVLAEAGEPATGSARFKWTPKAKPSKSTGTLGMPLTGASEVTSSGKVTAGPYVPLMFTAAVTESWTGEATCGAKPVKKGTFGGTGVQLLY
jgi:YVTN family beta-propeller protein